MTEPQSLQIAISGTIGSGKSSIARRLAELFQAQVFSTGVLQRQFARERGMTTLELNLHSEGDHTIDERLDTFTASLDDAGYSFVIDSRMAWHFLPRALKVYLTVDPSIAAERVIADDKRDSTEAYQNLDEARKDILARQGSERRRFQRTYGVDLTDPTNYDLVLETSYLSPTLIVEVIAEVWQRFSTERRFPHLLLAPRSLYPTEHVRGVASSKSWPDLDPLDPAAAIDVLEVQGRFYIYDGHNRVSKALFEGAGMVPGHLRGRDSDTVAGGISVAEYVKDLSPSHLYDWEDAHNFRFRSYPDRQG